MVAGAQFLAQAFEDNPSRFHDVGRARNLQCLVGILSSEQDADVLRRATNPPSAREDAERFVEQSHNSRRFKKNNQD